ncbi:acyltransferase family protein [Pseudomonas nitroreducens]|uniref:acyltransferase family protein n=1 Tax=Pseudomonas nitroreducens TaxID=46680 RepID=UPI0037F5EC1F
MINAKNLEIEYLRALAIVLTVVTHLPTLLPFFNSKFLSLFSVYMPWTGVDLFFCISGYVVSKSYLEHLDRYREKGLFVVAAQSFWLRRLFRLLPTAWLWILVPLVLSLTFNQSGIFGSWFQNLRSLTAVMTFTANLANQYDHMLGPNGVYWSLALEEQFYFLFPLFLLLVRSWRWRVGVLLGLITMQFALSRDPFAGPVGGILFAFRLDAMMWGVILYLINRTELYRQFEPAFLARSGWARLLFAGLLVYLLGAIPGQLIALPVAVGLVAIVSLLLVGTASYDKGYLPVPAALSGVLSWLGSRSYALYVIHICAFRASFEVWHRYAQARGMELGASFTLELVLTALVMMLLAAELNYRLLEQPLRRKGAELASRRLAHFSRAQDTRQDSTRLTAAIREPA